MERLFKKGLLCNSPFYALISLGRFPQIFL